MGTTGTARAPARVVFTSGFSHRYTSGVKQFEIEAATLRGVIKAMEARFPGIGDILEEETSVVIDGEMHEVVYTQPLKPGCEVFFSAAHRRRLGQRDCLKPLVGAASSSLH